MNKTAKDTIKKTKKRATLIIQKEILSLLKGLAAINGTSTQDVVTEAFNEYFKNKRVKPIPQKIKKI